MDRFDIENDKWRHLLLYIYSVKTQFTFIGARLANTSTTENHIYCAINAHHVFKKYCNTIEKHIRTRTCLSAQQKRINR